MPVEILPGCTTTETIRDLFWHPFTGDKRAPVVRGQACIPQAMQMVLAGANGPLHVTKGLFIATLSTNLPHQLPRVLSVAEPLGQLQAGLSFLVDCPASLSCDLMFTLHISSYSGPSPAEPLARTPGAS